MRWWHSLAARVANLRVLRPNDVRALAATSLSELIDREAPRARRRVEELKRRYPSAGIRELAQRLIDAKKQLGSLVGGVTGVFGIAAVPLDLIAMAYLQMSLLAELSTLWRKGLRSELDKQALVDLFGYANGLGPVSRSSPRLLGGLAGLLLTKGGLKGLGRAVPLVAAPMSAYVNNAHLQQVGDTAVGHFEGWARTEEKLRASTPPSEG